MEGWIKLHRRIKEHWIWSDANKFKWWADILIEVNHKQVKVNIGNELIDCNMGQSIRSLQGWAKSWNVSKDTARNFLNLLQKDKMITVENLVKTTRITVCNYDTYQTSEHDHKTQGKRKANARQTQTGTNKNENNEENEKNIIAYLNSVVKKNFKPDSSKTKQLIQARMKDGFSEADFKKVIDTKSKKWLNDPVMSPFLRPETLFGTKFEGYLNESTNTNRQVPNGPGGAIV